MTYVHFGLPLNREHEHNIKAHHKTHHKKLHSRSISQRQHASNEPVTGINTTLEDFKSEGRNQSLQQADPGHTSQRT